jgi:hypothetical protein
MRKKINKYHLHWTLCFCIFSFLFSSGIACISGFPTNSYILNNDTMIVKFSVPYVSFYDFFVYFMTIVLIGEGLFLSFRNEIENMSKQLEIDGKK